LSEEVIYICSILRSQCVDIENLSRHFVDGLLEAITCGNSATKVAGSDFNNGLLPGGKEGMFSQQAKIEEQNLR
jgi:hypothetical protein